MPPTNRDWAFPFLEQAGEDLRAAWVLAAQPSSSPSTLCMLIQMVFEKLAKAAFAQSGQVVPRKHQVATRLFLILKRHPSGSSLLNTYPNVEQFVIALENAHPAVAGIQTPQWPQLEYPWEDTTTGTVQFPAHHLYLVHRVQDPKDLIALQCLKFASAMEKQLFIIIP